MPDQDNVSMERISLSGSDFAEDLGSFGIQDTQILANKDLNKFLLSDPDTVKNVDDEEEKVEQKSQPKQQQQKQPQQKQQVPTEDEDEEETPLTRKQSPKKEQKEEKANGKDFLDKYVFGGDDEDEASTETNVDPKDAPQSADEDTYSTLAKDLMRLGVFSKNSDDESEDNIDIKTPEEFLERFSLEKKKGAISILDNFLNQFGDDYRQMFDAVFVNGVKPQEYLQSFAKMEAINSLDISSESNQERIVRAYYKGLKWDENKIEGRIQKLKDYGDLEDEAKTYQEILLNKEREQLAETERKKQEELQEAKLKELNARKSLQRVLTDKLKAQDFDGIPLNEKEAQAALEYMTDKKYKLPSGELLSEYDKDLLELSRPENHELKVKLALLLRKKLDLKDVKKQTISKKSDQLFTLSTKNAKNNQKDKETKSFF